MKAKDLSTTVEMTITQLSSLKDYLMKPQAPKRIRTISEFHQYRQLAPPEHPLISVIDYSQIRPKDGSQRFVQDFYSISLKRTSHAKMKYGQQPYDFDSGVLFFMAPQQVLTIQHDGDTDPQHTGWLLLIHPDFLWNTPLATAIKKYAYFDYAVHEALFLSPKEEAILHHIIANIQHEYHSNLDQFSQQIILSQIETLLIYSERFYQRQFITRRISNHQVLAQLEALLNEYLKEDIVHKGIPSVQYVCEALHTSPSYLSGLLKSLTGQSTQQHIHDKLIAVAKEKLSTTNLSVSEIAYALGFEHPQSFSKLFKHKTAQTPLAFRASFN